MSLTRDFYTALDCYMYDKKKVDGAYRERLRQLECAKGSQLYDDEVEKAGKEREDETKRLKQRCEERIKPVLEGMRKALAERKAIPPTDEQMRILQALKLRDKVSQLELEEAARSMDGNALGIEIIQELSAKMGYHRSYADFSKEFSRSTAERMIDGLESGYREILGSMTSKGAKAAAEYHAVNYGGEVNEDDLPQRSLFKNEAECIHSLGVKWDPGEGWEKTVQAFSDAVG